MPIAKEYKRYYGHRWRTIVRPKILQRAGGLCERCGRCPQRLEVAHLDQHPPNDAPENLAALCAGCHRRADYATWARKASETRRRRKDRARPLLREL
jgi:5-methylcytosine-specific restriction endonuclease McrA